MKNIIIGLLCVLLPIYSFITWLLICENPNLTTQQERVAAYFKTYFMDLSINAIYLSLLNIFLVAIGMYFVSKVEGSGLLKVFKNLLLFVLGFLGLINIWGIM